MIPSKETAGPTNRLINEKSPYLLQHAHNPVDWYPWGEEAFRKAEQENKPILLSIGYSTCHWCHVMERESFENQEIAKLMNDYFVPVKVDREERPDIDNVYMTAVTAMTGQGGWPLTIFLTPTKKPFFGGTYFPPEPKWGAPGFKEVLLSIHDAWERQRSQLMVSGESLIAALKQRSSAKGQDSPMDDAILTKAYHELSGNFDPRFGGFGQSPKFPMGHGLSFLLRYWKRFGEDRALEIVIKTLSSMAEGGIYDHLGGGLHRYSTDERWQVPHFEKMLYDQAISARAYLEAYQATQKPEFARTARDIFEYVLRELRSPEGGFLSAEDADSVAPEAGESSGHSEKKEGAFYVWAQKEIEAELGKDQADIFKYCFGIEAGGNVLFDPHGEFVGKNILHRVHSNEEAGRQFSKPLVEIEQSLEQSRRRLLEVRLRRPRPHLDDKILTDWNGLMISSLAFGARVLEEPRYQKAAEEAAEFILQTLSGKDGRLLHRYRDGEAAICGTIEDYAFFIHGLLDLYEANQQAHYLQEALRLTREMVRFFEDPAGGFFFTAADAEELIFRRKEIYDGAIPSGNSVAALDLARLAKMTCFKELEESLQTLFKSFAGEMARHPSAYAFMLTALDFSLGPVKEIVFAAEREDGALREMLRLVNNSFIPHKIILYLNSESRKAVGTIAPFVQEYKMLHSKATVYVCENHICRLPVVDIDEFKKLLLKT